MTTKNRVSYYTNDSFAEDDRHMGTVYWVVKVTENQPGYERVMPCNSLGAAEHMAERRNAIVGTKQDDVLSIVISSMAAGKVAR